MKQKHVLVFLVVLFSLSIITGIVYGVNHEFDVSKYLETLDTHQNVYLMHLGLICLFFFLTLSLIGIIALSVIIGIEGISLGYIFTIFFIKYKFKGILFVLVHFLLNKVILLLVLSYLFYVSYNYIKKIIYNLVGKSNDYIKNLYIPLLKKYFLVLIVTFVNSTFIYFCSNFILKYISVIL